MIKRTDFPFLSDKKIIYFDNAATSLTPRLVISTVQNYYTNYATNVHRGLSVQAEKTDSLYEKSRSLVANFINSKEKEIIFTSGATMSVNLIARSWGESNLKKGDIVVLSIAEHHANIVPWLQLQEKIGIIIKYIPLTKNYNLDIETALSLLDDKKVKVLALTQASNVLGLLFPVEKLIKYARARGILTIIDATLSSAHHEVDVKKLACDFLFFSGHKILGPTGIGVLYGRQEILEAMPPFLGGGSMINSVSQNEFTSTDLPYKFEAGTPNIAGVIGLGAAINYLNKISWSVIYQQEQELTTYFLQKIKQLKFAKVLGTKANKLPVFSLDLEGLHPHDAADLLGQAGIIVRAGHHCAQPLHDYLKVKSSLRISLSFYNTKKEIDLFVKNLQEIYQQFN